MICQTNYKLYFFSAYCLIPYEPIVEANTFKGIKFHWY